MQHFLNRLLEPKTNSPEITFLLAELLKVKVTGSTIQKELEEHPNYPSLLSISDVLDNYGIENMSLKLDSDRFIDIPVPFITQIIGKNTTLSFFTIVREINTKTVFYFDPEAHKWLSLTSEAFFERCSGVALLVEVAESAGEKDYYNNLKNEEQARNKTSLAVIGLPIIAFTAGAFALLQGGRNALLPVVFLLSTLAGAIVSALLMWHELDQYNPVLLQICGTSKKTNCGAVLRSKASKIAGISWAALGFSYFMAQLLLLLLDGVTNLQVLFIAAWLNAIAVPYIIFSVYYQWRIAKQWCVMCLFTQGVLFLQLIITTIAGWHTALSLSSFTILQGVQIVTALAVPFIGTIIILPALQKAKEKKHIHTELQRLKHNPQVFKALLARQKMVTEPTNGLGITLGNPAAKYKIIKVCNPYCGPCAKAHKPIEHLLQHNDDIQVQIIFNASNKEGDVKALPVKHFLAIDQKNGQPTIQQALDDWYLAEKRDYEIFASKYPMNGELKQQASKIEAMEKWCKKIHISFTPTFFVSVTDEANTDKESFYQLPELYSVTDLKYFLSI